MLPTTHAMCVDEASLALHIRLACGITKMTKTDEHCAKTVATLLAQPKTARRVAYAGTISARVSRAQKKCALPSGLLPKTMEEVNHFVCLACSEYECNLCGRSFPQTAYSSSMWQKRHLGTQRTLCLDCSRPRCTAKHCKTCRTCRSENCTKTIKRSHCSDDIVPLHPKHLPQTMQEVQEFLCSKCRYITCVRKDSQGIMCGKEMPKKAKTQLPAAPKNKYVCGVCQSLDHTKKTLANGHR